MTRGGGGACTCLCPVCTFVRLCVQAAVFFPEPVEAGLAALLLLHQVIHADCLFLSCIMSCRNVNRKSCPFQAVFSKVSWNVVSGEMLLHTDGETGTWTKSQWGLSWALVVGSLYPKSPFWGLHLGVSTCRVQLPLAVAEPCRPSSSQCAELCSETRLGEMCFPALWKYLRFWLF